MNTCAPTPVKPLNQSDWVWRIGKFQPDFRSSNATGPGKAERGLQIVTGVLARALPSSTSWSKL